MTESVRTVLFDIIARDRASQAFQSAGKGAETMGAKVAGVGKTMSKTVTPAAGAVGLAFRQAFNEFDAGADAIRAGTGATGKALDGLTKSMKSVAVGVAEPISTVGEAIASVNQRLGLTGKPLEGLTKQFVNLAHVTGTDVQANIEQVTGAFNNFGVAAGDQPKKLDELFRASQLTGVSVAQLAQDMAANGPVLRQAGVGFDQAAALLGSLGKAGLSAGDVLPSVSKALAKAAKEGKPANEVLAETFRAIKGAKNDTDATAAALEVFGARGGPKLAGLIREGKLSFDDLKNSIVTGKDTINKTAADTADWSEKLQMLKNRMQVVLGPIGQTGMAVAGIAAGIGPALVGLGKLGPAFGKVASLAGKVASGAAQVVSSGARAAAAAVAQGARMVASFAATAASAIASAAATAGAWLVAAAPFIALGLVIAGVVIVIVKNWDTIRDATKAAWNAVVGFVSGAWDRITGFVRGAISFLTNLFLNFTGPGLIIKHFDTIVGFVRDMPGRIASVAKGMFDGIKEAFRTALNWIIRGWNKLEFKIPGFKVGPVHFGGFTLGVPDIPTFDNGGVMPGPRGVHNLAWVAGGETIIPTHKPGVTATHPSIHTGDINITTVDPYRAARDVVFELRALAKAM